MWLAQITVDVFIKRVLRGFLSVLVGFICDDTSGRCVCSCVSFTVNVVIEIVSVMLLLRSSDGKLKVKFKIAQTGPSRGPYSRDSYNSKTI